MPGLPDVSRFREEDNFSDLYDRILEHLIPVYHISRDTMEDAICKIVYSFRYNKRHRFAGIDLTLPEMRLGLVFRYGSHGAGLTRYKMLQALHNCTELQQHILKKNHLNIVSFGCGFGNGMIGFCSALHQFQFSGSLGMDVVDSVPQWQEIVTEYTNCLRQEDFGDVSDFFQLTEAELNFIHHNLTDDFPMEKYDVVFMSKLLSIIDWDDKKKFVRNLYSRVKESALILLIDSSFDEKLWRNFEVLYISDEEKRYQSSVSLERFGHNDRVKSKARIAVMRKNKQCQSSITADFNQLHR